MSTSDETGKVGILLVDDRPGNLTSLAGILQRPDYDLVLARTGQEALALVLRQEFAVILLDVAMPGMDGFETAAIIKEREQSKRIPIIFITASVYEMEHIFRGYTVGAVDYLRKPVDSHQVRGKVAVFVEMFRQRKRIERQSMQLSEVERRVEFLAITAHELKTPFTPLRLQTASLLRDAQMERRAAGAPSERLLRRLQKIDLAASRIESLIDRLLDLSQLSSGEMSLALGDVDLRDLVEGVAFGLGGEAVRSGSGISVDAPEPAVGRWDRARLEQVVTNLLLNAIQNGEGRPIDVTVSMLGDRARLSVKDRGSGIPPADQQRIFERFERLTPVRHFGGFGIGLWTVREIVEAHGGHVTVRSQPGEGSVFTVELPAHPPAESGKESPPPEDAAQNEVHS